MTKTATPEKPAPERALVLIDPKLEEGAKALDELATSYGRALAASTAGATLCRSLLVGSAIEALRKALTGEVWKRVLSLQNTPLGFMTDRGPHCKGDNQQPYPEGVVRDCVVAALLAGFRLDGNEFNVLSWRFYGTQAGYKRKLQEVPGISNIKIACGLPRADGGQMVVRVRLSWKIDGTPDELMGPDGKPGIPFPVVSWGKESADQLQGKAKRRAYKAAWEQVTGSRLEPDDDTIDPDLEALPAPDGRQAGNVRARLNGGPQPATAEQQHRIRELMGLLGMEEGALEGVASACNVEDWQRPSREEAGRIIAALERKAESEAG